MNCKNCGKSIPNQSLFCPYCDASSPAMLESAAPISSYAPQSQSVSDKMKGKVKTCPRCGTLLGKREKVCSVCGEVMPKPQKSRKAKTAIISMSVVICLLVCSTVYFMLEMFQGNRAIDELREENKDLKAEVADLEADVKYYCDKAKNNQSKINSLEQKIKDLNPWIGERSGQYSSPAYRPRR